MGRKERGGGEVWGLEVSAPTNTHAHTHNTLEAFGSVQGEPKGWQRQREKGAV